jgi:stage II sporulation protein P
LLYGTNWKHRGEEGDKLRKYYRRKISLFSWLIAVALILLFFLAGIWIGVNKPYTTLDNYTNSSSSLLLLLVGILTDSHKAILNMTIPVLGLNMDSHLSDFKINNSNDIVSKVFAGITNLGFNNSKKLLGSEIAFINNVELETDDEIISESSELTEEERAYFEELERKSAASEKSSDNDKPLVLIYNTHNSETYAPTDGVEKVEGKNGGIEKVAAYLEKVLLEKYGVKSVRSTTIHDYPDWERSYINSAETVKKLLKENPSVQIVLDIHRDAGLPEKGVITTATGANMAKVLIVVGSDNRLDHPNWQQNWQFAKMMGYKMDKLYPGLLKAVRVQTGRYNQHLHHRSLILEMGCSQNTLEEALLSAEAMADVINEVLLDLRQENTF